MDIRDRTPIAYAHVGMPNLGIGVVTNEVGVFTLHYPSMSIKDTIQISFMGYKTYSFKNAEDQRSDTVRIYLTKDILQLSDITIKPYSDSGRIIVKKALDEIKKNFPTKIHQINAFYREKVQNRDDYRFTRLMEGMIDIQDWGIQSNPDRIRVRLNEFRKSNNMAKQTWGQWAWKKLFGEQNNLYSIYLQDPIRIHMHNEQTTYSAAGRKWKVNSRRYWLGELLNNPKASVRLVDITSYNEEQVYHIKFKYPEFYGSIYVNCNDYGIYKIEYQHSTSFEHWRENVDTAKFSKEKKELLLQIEKNSKASQFEGKYAGKLTVDYQKIDHKYYLSLIQWVEMGDFRQSNVKQGESTVSYNTCTLMVNSVEVDKKEMEKVKVRNIVSKDESTNHLRRKYNESFWKNYNVLLATPLENKVIRDLAFEESLEKQFKNNQ